MALTLSYEISLIENFAACGGLQLTTDGMIFNLSMHHLGFTIFVLLTFTLSYQISLSECFASYGAAHAATHGMLFSLHMHHLGFTVYGTTRFCQIAATKSSEIRLSLIY